MLAVLLVVAMLAGPTGCPLDGCDAVIYPHGADVWVRLDNPAQNVKVFFTLDGLPFDVTYGPQEPGWYIYQQHPSVGLLTQAIEVTSVYPVASGVLHRQWMPLALHD